MVRGFVCHALALWNNLDFLYICFWLIFELVCWDCLYSPTLLFSIKGFMIFIYYFCILYLAEKERKLLFIQELDVY